MEIRTFFISKTKKARTHETPVPEGPGEHANASWDQCIFVLSHLVLWEDVGVGHAAVNQPCRNKKLSLIEFQVPKGNDQRIL